MLPRHARCVFSLLCCNGRSLLLNSCLSRIGRSVDISCSACSHATQDTSHLILHCPGTDSGPFTLWCLFVSLRLLIQALGYFQASGAPWPSSMPLFLVRGRVTKTKSDSVSMMDFQKWSATCLRIVNWPRNIELERPKLRMRKINFQF